MHRTNNTIGFLFLSVFMVLGVLMIASMFQLYSMLIKLEEEHDKFIQRDEIVAEVIVESPDTGIEETEEDPYEEMHTKIAVVSTIGTSDENEAFGYDFSYVCRVVMAESGSNSDELQTAIATCIYNACVKENWKYSPEEICTLYGYAEPAVMASDRVIQNTLDVLYFDNRNTSVGEAVYFYNPSVCGRSWWHDSQIYVCNIGEVEFYK